MIKKISAIVLALVLCMSVVVLPVSAYSDLELPSGSSVAVKLEWDQSSYSAGDTAYLNIYWTVDESFEYQNAQITIGINDAYLGEIGETTTSELFQSFYKSPEQGNMTIDWLAPTYQTKVQSANTADENAAYNKYIKLAIAKTTGANGGTHPSMSSAKNGLPGAEINEVDGPMITLSFEVLQDCTAGVDLVAAITSGSASCSPAQTYFKYMTNPGVKTTAKNFAVTAVSLAEAVTPEVEAACDHSADKLTWTTVTASTCKTAGTEKGVCSCGEYETTRALPLDAANHEGPKSWTTVTAPTYTTAGSEKEVCTACTKDTGNTRPLPIKEFVTGLKGQIRFHKDENGAYAESFDVRALATIPAAKFEEVFTADKATQKSMIKEVGFVFASGASVTAPSMDDVKALVENGTAVVGYTKKTVEYISTSLVKDNYTFSCIVADIPDAQKTNSLVAVGYIAWDSNADGKIDSYAYYPTAQTISFAGLFNTHYADAFGA